MTPPSRSPDDEQLHALFRRMLAAWTVGDAGEYGACFTEDCDYISFDGFRAHGRAAVVDAHHQLFTGVLYRSALVGEVERLHRLDPDVAMIHATGSVRVAWRRTPPRRRLTRSTITAVRTPDGWRAAAIHNARIRPATIPAPDSAVARVVRGLVRTSTALGVGQPSPPGRPDPWAPVPVAFLKSRRANG